MLRKTGLMGFAAIIGLLLLIQGCDVMEEINDYEYDIEVVNDALSANLLDKIVNPDVRK